EEPEPITFAEFLESIPPAQSRTIDELWQFDSQIFQQGAHLRTPELQLHCTSDMCNGIRIFRYSGGSLSFPKAPKEQLGTYIAYLCSNCLKETKLYSISAVRGQRYSGECFKFGEIPIYGPPTPARLIRLFGKDRDIFLKGRQCENHGLGIGAFVYYRRVV